MNFFIFAIFAIFCSIAASKWVPDTLQPGGQFEGDGGMLSPNGQYYLRVKDGDLILMDLQYKDYVWSSQTEGSGATKAIMQTDGEFCLQTASGAIVYRTYTKDAGSVLKLQDDANFVVISPKGYPVWNAKSAFEYKTPF
jgi:hypothetical protein